MLKVLTEPTRLRLLSLLLEEELTVAELQGILGMAPQSRISANLALLYQEALVTQRRVGKNVFSLRRALSRVAHPENMNEAPTDGLAN